MDQLNEWECLCCKANPDKKKTVFNPNTGMVYRKDKHMQNYYCSMADEQRKERATILHEHDSRYCYLPSNNYIPFTWDAQIRFESEQQNKHAYNHNIFQPNIFQPNIFQPNIFAQSQSDNQSMIITIFYIVFSLYFHCIFIVFLLYFYCIFIVFSFI